jgi:hypothetical protein
MKHPQKTPAGTGATKKTGKSISQSQYNQITYCLQPIQIKIMDYLAVSGNSLNTPDAAKMGIQHLPTHISQITAATGITPQREWLNGFKRYTLSTADRKKWREIRKGAA